MGDRCNLVLNWRKSDTQAIMDWAKEGRDFDPFSQLTESGTSVLGHVEEANYGWYDELNELAKSGIPFHGYHSEGGEYGPGAFACWQGQYLEVPTDRDGRPVVAYNSKMQPDRSDINEVRAYYRALKQADKYINRKEPKR